MHSSRDLKLMAVLTGAFLALAAAVLFGGVHADLLLVAPLLVLVVPLLGGRYVGEDGLERLRAARHVPAPPRARSTSSRRRTPVRVVRAGLLLAGAHASRPPPAGLAATA